MYFDPYMQKAMLLDDEDPNALLDATGAPVAAPPAPQYPSPSFPGFGPTGPLGASQGLQPVDPELQRKANIMGMFSNINQVAGGRGLDNPFQNQIDLNQKMQLERMRQLRQNAIDNPFFDYELAKSKGYFKLNEGEDDAKGFRRFTQEQFKDPTKSVYSEKVEGLVASGIDETLANQYVNGAVEARTGPGGITQLINKLTGEVEGTLTAEQAAAIESTVAQGKSFGENIGQKIETSIQDLNAIGGEELVLQQAVEGINYWTEKLSEKDADGNYVMDTGLIQGLMTDLGVADFAYGELDAAAVEAKLRNLQIVNLAPVTEKELKLLGKLFAGTAVMNEQNLGTLQGYLKRVEEKQADVARRKGNAIFTLDANYDYLNAPNRTYLNNRYGTGEEGSWRPATADSVRFNIDE